MRTAGGSRKGIKMLECKDCCLYNTDACRYGKYALEHNMSLNCDDFIVEHNKAYQQGYADAIDEIIEKFSIPSNSGLEREIHLDVRELEQLKENKNE